MAPSVQRLGFEILPTRGRMTIFDGGGENDSVDCVRLTVISAKAEIHQPASHNLVVPPHGSSAFTLDRARRMTALVWIGQTLLPGLK